MLKKKSLISHTTFPLGVDLTTGIPGPVNPGVTTISSTVTFTIEDNEYVCDVIAGGRVCEMWGYSNGYGNNFDSQYIPFQCDDIGGKAYEGYIAFQACYRWYWTSAANCSQEGLDPSAHHVHVYMLTSDSILLEI